MKRYNDVAIVLRSYKLGESDRIVVLLTKENGKVRAVAKGVRKMKSRFGSRLEPFNYVKVQIHRGRGELDFIVEVESISQFPLLRTTLGRLDDAFCLLEIVDLVTLDGRPKLRIFEMLSRALKLLETSDSPILVPAFSLKLLAQEGFKPELDLCVMCGDSTNLVSFDSEEGGMCCVKCGKGIKTSVETLELMREILGGKLSKALSSSNPKKVIEELDKLALGYLEHRFERPLKTKHKFVSGVA